jgi:hypothetical protein
MVARARDIEAVIERDHVLGLRNQQLISMVSQASQRFILNRTAHGGPMAPDHGVAAEGMDGELEVLELEIPD